MKVIREAEPILSQAPIIIGAQATPHPTIKVSQVPAHVQAMERVTIAQPGVAALIVEEVEVEAKAKATRAQGAIVPPEV